MMLDNDDSVNMIGHDHKLVDPGICKMFWNFPPKLCRCLSQNRQAHVPLNNGAEKALMQIVTKYHPAFV
jgi:hypothetical protein